MRYESGANPMFTLTSNKGTFVSAVISEISDIHPDWAGHRFIAGLIQ